MHLDLTARLYYRKLQFFNSFQNYDFFIFSIRIIHFFYFYKNNCYKAYSFRKGIYMSNQNRKFSRVPFKVKAELTVNKAIYIVEKITNLSIGGCLLPIKTDIAAGTICHLKILLNGPDNLMHVNIDGEIKRCTFDAVAVKFTRIDPDSFFHLQNIVRFNSINSDVIEKEIIEHPGIL